MNKYMCICKCFTLKVGDIIYCEKRIFQFEHFWKIKGDKYYYVLRIGFGSYENYLSETDFRKYFISLAEWREKQIKSVLDD
jgi:hypothetical protein